MAAIIIPSSLETAQPTEVVRWAAEAFGADNLVVTASFEDAVLVHVAATAVPGIEITLLDTQYLFAETQWLVDELRKVEPLARAIAGKQAWITGVRRADGPTRAGAPVAAYDIGRGLVKVNPLATLTDDDMALYVQLYDLPAHPLADKGYASIGCWPCTRPVAPGEDKRAGRWSGNAKTECGLHV